MSGSIGISIGRSETRGVVVARDRVTWHGRSAIGHRESVGQSLARLLESMPPSGRLKPRVCVALGLSYSQLKLVHSLPAGAKASVLREIVRQNPDTFFLRYENGSFVSCHPELSFRHPELSFRHPERSEGSAVPTRLWAAALDAGVVTELIAVLRNVGFTRVTFIPSLAAVGVVAHSGIHEISDDRIAFRLTIANGGITDVRRILDYDGLDSAPPSALMGDMDPRGEFSAAIGATQAVRSPFAWRPPRDHRTTAWIDRGRVAVAASLLVASTAAAVAAPGIRASRDASASARVLTAVGAARIEAARAESELRLVNGQLDRVARFVASRGKVTQLVGAISEALPDSAALVTLRVDTLDATFTVLAPSSAAVLTALADVAAIDAPKIAGSITRENVSGARVERATVRFRRVKGR